MTQNINKGGRPKLPEGSQRTNMIRFRVTAMEQMNIEEKARMTELKIGDYLREVGQYSKVYARISEAELHIHRDYIGAYYNLNRPYSHCQQIRYHRKRSRGYQRSNGLFARSHRQNPQSSQV